MKFHSRIKCGLIIIFLIIPGAVMGQIGGQSVYSFLNTSPSARISAVGGHQPALQEKDLSLSYQNPALIDTSLHNQVSLGYVRYLADINMGFASHARHFEGVGDFQASLHFLDYGEFQRADEYGNRNGTFTAGDFALTVGHGRQFGPVRGGANFKIIYSSMESYHSMGIALDAGTFYYNQTNEFGVAASVRNLGIQLYSYSGNGREPLPLDIQVGATKKLINAPFRFTLVAHSLQNPDLTFKTGERIRDPETGEWGEKDIPLEDRILRHLTAGTELVFSENFQVRFGYNHQRRKELALSSRQGIVGFSWGFGLGISRFKIDFSRATYHLAATSTHLTISTDMDKWFIKN